MFDFLKKKNPNQNQNQNIDQTTEQNPKPIRASEQLAQKAKAPLLKPQPVATKVAKKTDWKKLMITIAAVAGGVFLLYLVIAFYILATSEKGEMLPLIADGTPAFLNVLVAGVYIIFLICALVAFVMTMIPLFKLVTAKVEEVEKRKKAKKGLIIYGIIFFVFIIAWAASFLYMENRRDVLELNIVHAPIETTPEDTLQLSAPIEIKFDATHADYDPANYKVILYNWDFGDGDTEIGDAIVTHEYTEKGRYIVTLTIEKKDLRTQAEAKDTHTKEVSITNQSLTAMIEAEPQAGEAPLKVQFDASGSVDPDGKIGEYEWDLDGDGEIDDEYNNELTPEFTYEKIGNYEVTLRITSSTGEEYDVATKQILVGQGETPDAIVEVANDPSSYEKGVEYIFKGGESVSPNGKIVAYEWDFGDGTPLETSKTVTHTYDKEGVFDLILKVTDEEDKEGETLVEMVIGERPGTPTAVIVTTPALTEGALSLEGQMPFMVEFDASSSTDSDENLIEYSWDFDGDGKYDSYGKKVKNTFEEEGTYTVTLKVADLDDNEDKTTIGIKVAEQTINATLEATPQEGEVPLTVKFDATGSTHPSSSISSYRWDFGDGTNPVLGSGKMNHKYTEIGEFTATVTAIGKDNSTDEKEIYIVVRAVQVTACFEPSRASGVAPLEVIFDPDCSTGTVTNYSWSFGNGSTSKDVKPSYTFEKPGIYPATLEVTDSDNNVGMTTIEIEVTEEEE